MVDVLIVAGMIPPRQNVLADALAQLRARGARVHLGCQFDPAELTIDEELAERRSFRKPISGAGIMFRGAVRTARPGRLVWLHARRDPWLHARAREADLLVALDPSAVHTVWQLAQRNLHAKAIVGLRPALRSLDLRPRDRPRRRWWDALRPAARARVLISQVRGQVGDTVRMAGYATTGRRVMRSGLGRAFWRSALAAPGVPDRPRAALTMRVVNSMNRVGHRSVAVAVITGAARRLREPNLKAQLAAARVQAELEQGRIPSDLGAVIAKDLTRADSLFKGTSAATAIPPLTRAVDLLFHRVLHFDGLSSPLAEDPDGYLAPLHGSAVGRALAAPRGRTRSAAPAPADRAHRLLFLTGLNDAFLTPIRSRYENMAGVEVRALDLSASPVRAVLRNGRAKLIANAIAGDPDTRHQAADVFGADLDWADTVFVDWCNVTAGILSLVDPAQTRVVLRLHSFEAFSWWPHLVDFSRVDDLIFVSEHLRDLTMAAVPRLRAAEAPRTHVMANAMDLRQYPAGKPAEARFNLGLVGIGSVAKDPLWTIDVLREVRRHDSRYRLLLVGKDLDPKLSAVAKQYRDRYERELVELEAAGVVRRLGQTQDVPAALVDVGVILSSSVRESFHCALVEGAASGAVPVVRDWPFFADRARSAKTLFPPDWVVQTPEEAAKRILSTTATEEGWRESGRVAADHAMSTWDWTVIQREFDRLLLGG